MTGAQEGAEVIPFERGGIGHNEAAAIADFIQKRRIIWAARVPSAVKVIALAIMEHMTPDNMECWPSKDRLAFMCNMPRATFDRHYNAAKELFNYHERRGKTTVFSPKIIDVAKELAVLWPTGADTTPARYRYAPPPNMRGGQNQPPSKMTYPQTPQTPPQIGGPTPPQNGGTKRQGIDHLETHRENARAREWEDGVKVNGTAIIIRVAGRELKFDYQSIDYWATTSGCPSDRARMIVESVGRGWVVEGRCVDHPATWMQRQIARWRVRKASDDAEIAKSAATGRTARPETGYFEGQFYLNRRVVSKEIFLRNIPPDQRIRWEGIGHA